MESVDLQPSVRAVIAGFDPHISYVKIMKVLRERVKKRERMKEKREREKG